MERSCSFESLVGTLYGVRLIEGISRDQLRLFVWFCQTIEDVTGHRSTWSLSGIESETDFILAQS